jgi:enterochelin esterase-like enzyme
VTVRHNARMVRLPGALTALVAALGPLCACAPAVQRLTYVRVESPAMQRTMEYGVYTPPGFTPGESLPLVVFLHGGGDDAHCLDKEGVSAWLDQEITQGRLPRLVVAVPQGDTGFWANWADGSARYVDWALDEVVPRVAKDYGTRPCPEGCHLLGISMGGSGVLRIALDDPRRFASAAIVSAPTFDSEQMKDLAEDWRWKTFARLDRVFGPASDVERRRRADPFQRWLSASDVGPLKIYLAHGDDDRKGIAGTNAALHRHLEARGIAHQYRVFHGGHRWKDWLPVFGEALRSAIP